MDLAAPSLRDLRISRNLSQEEVAAMIRVTRSSIQKAEDYNRVHRPVGKRILEFLTGIAPVDLIVVDGDVARIRLSGKVGRGLFALIDASDVHMVSAYSWWANPRSWPAGEFVVVGYVDGKCRLLHRHILNVDEGILVDHRNHEGLDCRRENLRLCDTTENMMNRRKLAPGISKFKGVRKTPGGRWFSVISVQGIQIYLGIFDTETEAAAAYDARARVEYGEFAHLNFADNENDVECPSL